MEREITSANITEILRNMPRTEKEIAQAALHAAEEIEILRMILSSIRKDAQVTLQVDPDAEWLNIGPELRNIAKRDDLDRLSVRFLKEAADLVDQVHMQLLGKWGRDKFQQEFNKLQADKKEQKP